MLFFLVISIYAYLTFSRNDLFYIDKRILFVARHVMIFAAVIAWNPLGSEFLASERVRHLEGAEKLDKQVVRIVVEDQIQVQW